MADAERKPEADTPPDEVTIVYDGECPVCTAYGCTVELEPGQGQLNRINARDDAAIVDQLTRAGVDLDEGMAVMRDGRLYHGADAVHIMALHGSRRGLANQLNHLLFRSRARAHALYPAMRAGRNLLLRLLGRRPIGNLRSPPP